MRFRGPAVAHRIPAPYLAILLACAGARMSATAALEPRINYMLQCMGCHTPDGSGQPDRVPSLKATLGPFSSLPEGRRFLVQVPGAAQAALTDGELAAVLNWMVENLSAAKPERFTAFTAAEVAVYRGTPLIEVRTVRERLLLLLKQR